MAFVEIKCVKCNARITLGAASKGHEDALEPIGWRKMTDGWFCLDCAGHRKQFMRLLGNGPHRETDSQKD